MKNNIKWIEIYFWLKTFIFISLVAYIYSNANKTGYVESLYTAVIWILFPLL